MNLSTLYAQMSADERKALADRLGMNDAGYLWQLATRWRGKRPSLAFMEKLVATDKRLTLGELVEEFSNDEQKAGA